MKLNPQTTAFIFPGQGSQAVGMGGELATQFPDAKETFDEADSTLGFPLSKLMWVGPDTELNETVNTQPALYIHSIAAWRAFTRLYPAPSTLPAVAVHRLPLSSPKGAPSGRGGNRPDKKSSELG